MKAGTSEIRGGGKEAAARFFCVCNVVATITTESSKTNFVS